MFSTSYLILMVTDNPASFSISPMRSTSPSLTAMFCTKPVNSLYRVIDGRTILPPIGSQTPAPAAKDAASIFTSGRTISAATGSAISTVTDWITP